MSNLLYIAYDPSSSDNYTFFITESEISSYPKHMIWIVDTTIFPIKAFTDIRTYFTNLVLYPDNVLDYAGFDLIQTGT